MPVRPLVYFPDPRLRQPAHPVTIFDDALKDLAQDLLDTMHAAPGIGITAPHVGVLARLTVIELDPKSGPRTYVNPLITWHSDDTARHVEGSVSMPGMTDEIERSKRIGVAFQDLDGKECEEEADGLLAVCLQHEIDQLGGIFWLDRLSRLKRDRLIKRFNKITRQDT
ncbi:peptide deformylase [Microvirga puerhi]|uniref:Peptide deformylase-like n=1 Tax=Microvirga puerhi TaxID=2876078 RepID=A0ABS7VLD4_9HYPH|nr:peptide deformylase [Microvirga puerhi]MBZ6076044.1 peptide deformylase [Microvirga puerhi]